MEETLIIDIGGTKTNVSFVAASNSGIKILSSDIFPTHSNPDLQIQKITSIYLEKLKKTSQMSLSLPGLWDKNGVLLESFNLKNWIGYPFIKNLVNALNIKNHTWETDVICGALGEYSVQSETCKGMSLLYLNMGTGIGAAFIKNGKPFTSDSKDMPWHVPTLRMQKLFLSDGNELVPATDLLSGGSLLKETNFDSIEKLFENYKSGDAETFEIITKAQLQLAAWLINLFYLFAPDVIVLNGGLTYDWEVICEEAIDIANEELKEQIKILPSKLKEMAPIYGAYLNHYAIAGKVAISSTI